MTDSPSRTTIAARSPQAAVLPLLLVTGCLLLASVGCDTGPSAPELRDAPVYYNRAEGLRFLVPDGWTQSASSNLPPGDFEGQHFLVRYNVRSPEPNAQVQVLCIQDDGSTDLAAHHAKPAFGIKNWKLSAEPRTETVGGKEGTWLYYIGRNKDAPMAMEILCFRNRGRLYSLVGTFWERDTKGRQSIQRAFKSVVWDD